MPSALLVTNVRVRKTGVLAPYRLKLVAEQRKPSGANPNFHS